MPRTALVLEFGKKRNDDPCWTRMDFGKKRNSGPWQWWTWRLNGGECKKRKNILVKL